jgi:hypothetical protein
MLGAIVFLLFYILNFEPEPYIIPNDPYRELYDNVNKKKDDLEQQVNDLKIKYDLQVKKFDSLEVIKKQIKIIYVTKSSQIDTIGYNGIVDEFKSIFAKNIH